MLFSRRTARRIHHSATQSFLDPTILFTELLLQYLTSDSQIKQILRVMIYHSRPQNRFVYFISRKMLVGLWLQWKLLLPWWFSLWHGWWGRRRCFVARVKSKDTLLAVLIRDGRGCPTFFDYREEQGMSSGFNLISQIRFENILASELFGKTYRISGYLMALLLSG